MAPWCTLLGMHWTVPCLVLMFRLVDRYRGDNNTLAFLDVFFCSHLGILECFVDA